MTDPLLWFFRLFWDRLLLEEAALRQDIEADLTDFSCLTPDPSPEPEPIILTPVAPYWRTFRPGYDALQKRWVFWLMADPNTAEFVRSLPYFEKAIYDEPNGLYVLVFAPSVGFDQDSAENAYSAIWHSTEARFQPPPGVVERLSAFKEFVNTLDFDKASQ